MFFKIRTKKSNPAALQLTDSVIRVTKNLKQAMVDVTNGNGKYALFTPKMKEEKAKELLTAITDLARRTAELSALY